MKNITIILAIILTITLHPILPASAQQAIPIVSPSDSPSYVPPEPIAPQEIDMTGLFPDNLAVTGMVPGTNIHIMEDGDTLKNLYISFNHPMKLGSGTIFVHDQSSRDIVSTAPVTSSNIIIDDDNVTIKLNPPLPLDHDYYLVSDSKALIADVDSMVEYAFQLSRTGWKWDLSLVSKSNAPENAPVFKDTGISPLLTSLSDLHIRPPIPIGFPDVSETHWAKKEIDYLRNLGAVQGKEDGRFDPEGKMTKAELLKIIMTLISENTIDSSRLWQDQVKSFGLEQEIIDIDFQNENNNINRVEAAVMLLKGFDITPRAEIDAITFPDVTIDMDWRYLEEAKLRGVLRGYENGNFGPDDTLQRDQLAVIVYRMKNQ